MRYRSKGSVSREVLSKSIDALDESLQQTATEQEGTTVANEGKWYARDGHQPDGHCDVNEYVNRKQHGHAKGDQSAESVASEARDTNAVKQH